MKTKKKKRSREEEEEEEEEEEKEEEEEEEKEGSIVDSILNNTVGRFMGCMRCNKSVVECNRV